MFLIFSWATWVLLSFTIAALYFIWKDSKSQDGKKLPPGPKSWPIIGSLLYMAKFESTLEAFQAIGEEFGEVASLKLGSIESMVISGYKNFREILLARAHEFDARPDFKRFNMLFEGNKNNSLAFADYNDNHKKRRVIVSHHALAKRGSALFESFGKIATDKIENNMMNKVDTQVEKVPTEEGIHLKKVLQHTCLEVFMKYFCSLEIDSTNNGEFNEVLETFDDIFTEINNQCVADVFPSLMPFANKSHLHTFGVPIRKFMMKYCVEPRMKKAAEKLDSNNNNQDENDEEKPQTDLLDEFLENVGKYEEATLDNALFALEDMLGGATAASNFITQTCSFIAQNPKIQQKLREEVEAATDANGQITLQNHSLPYVEAVLWEATRKIGSPLVPHVATVDTTFKEFTVKKGTVMFFNIGEYNNSEKYWNKPEEFNPERFLKDGIVSKPEFFIPFGTGRRSCLGFRLAINLGVLIISNLCKSYELSTIEGESYKFTTGSLAIAGEGFKVQLTPINNNNNNNNA